MSVEAYEVEVSQLCIFRKLVVADCSYSRHLYWCEFQTRSFCLILATETRFIGCTVKLNLSFAFLGF
jgi:hypothetical protein